MDKTESRDCALEPIRLPGSIQPHGVLLVSHIASGIIQSASENCEPLLGLRPEHVLGRTVADVLRADLRAARPNASHNGDHPIADLSLNGNALLAQAVPNAATGQLLIDIEKVDRVVGPAATLIEMWHEHFPRLREAVPGKLANECATLIRHLTGFDRVMVYRFDEEWNGEVIAESYGRKRIKDRYLGHHFPASDIPEQARQLFQSCKARQVPDVHYQPSALLSQSDTLAIDLSRSTFRSASPRHIEYLKNMGVRGTLTGALMVEGRLWGLIACHHLTGPRYLGLRGQRSFRWICESVAVLIEAAQARDRAERRSRIASKRRRLVEQIRGNDVRDLLAEGRDALILDVLSADGFSLIGIDQVRSIGTTPTPERILDMRSRQRARSVDKPVFASNAFSRDLGMEETDDGCAGALVLSIRDRPELTLAWFRNERRYSVRWAGDPQHAFFIGKDEPFSPRRSFATFLQNISGESVAWTQEELEVAMEFGELIYIQILRDAEKSLRKYRGQLTTFVESSASCMAMLNRSMNYVATSQRWRLKFGNEHDDLVGRNHFQVLSDIPDEWRAAYLRCLAGATVGGDDYLWLRASGRREIVRWSAAPWNNENGEVGGIIVLLDDITEQHAARQAIHDVQERLAAIVNASLDAVIAIDASERILTFSTAAEMLFQTTAEEAIGKKLGQFIPPRFRDTHHEHIERFGALAAPQKQVTSGHALRKDGTEFPFEAVVSKIDTSDGRIYSVTIRDITERKRAEIVRDSLEAQLRESQKMEALGTMAGGIAHDFNNIIAAILGYAGLASEDLGAAPQAALGHIEEIRTAGLRARGLVKQILSFSRRQSILRTTTELGPIIHETVHLLQSVLPARVALAARCDSGVPAVLADASQIQQVLINLVTNAMHAIGGKAGRIDVHLGTAVLSPSAPDMHPSLHSLCVGKLTRTVLLSVSDNGCGIDAATREKIFDPFFTTKPVGEGTGLGLSVVHGIVKTHEGCIVVDSALGKGATFSIYLPVASMPAGRPEDAPISSSIRPRSGNAKRVLLVDDDEALVSLLTQQLRRRGYRVRGYSNQQEALAVVRGDPSLFDLVVTGYSMPGMSGIDVAREVHALRSDIPVVMTVGFIDEALQEAAVAAGVRAVILKTTDIEELCEVLSRTSSEAENGGGK